MYVRFVKLQKRAGIHQVGQYKNDLQGEGMTRKKIIGSHQISSHGKKVTKKQYGWKKNNFSNMDQKSN